MSEAMTITQYWANGCETGTDFWLLYGEKGVATARQIALLTKTDRESLNLIIDALNTDAALRSELARVTAERDEWKRATSGAQDELYKSQQRLAQAEQERDWLRTALESIANNTCCGPCQDAKLVAQQALRGEAQG